ncbi:Utp14-domain-containing protein [Microthyrium microscopicum]|uniref:Utp14-domain-containing protein n=1 Tax=Microthyrium microscopicum TaxID=703497 RepID=A0A6A6UP28_9PEZI|nr:Utp14-domain-containing protein [Microthyrium microscopicum]
MTILRIANMPPRISRSSNSNSASVSKPKPAKKRGQKRALNAFAIASAQNPEKLGVRRSRLGQTEDDPQDRKRRRVNESEDEDEDDEEEGGSRSQAKKKKTVRRDDVGESSEGSDSEGNAWTLGHVDQDDDSDIDSDDAFGEGDDELFAHFSFSGSSKDRKAKASSSSRKPSKKEIEVDLNDESNHSGSDSDSSLGEDAVDLAQMLDDYEASDDEMADSNSEGGSDNGSDDDEDEDAADGHFSNSSEDEDDEIDSQKLSRLQDLVSSLHPTTAEEGKRTSTMYESMTPSAAGIVSSEKFDIRDILKNTSDPQLAKASKATGVIPSQPKKKDPKLEPALPKLQRDKLDRIAANEKAKATLDRWVDTVKHMRRAEHVTFPLQSNEAAAHQTGYMLPTITTAPITSLESTINSILEESGLAPSQAKKEKEYDDLPETNISVQEVLARRADLRRARELIFQEERRAKRIKKIKSKSYRRVHRRERERLAAAGQDAFAEDFGDMDEDEKETHDRRRAEERMGAKHRDSKWAKQMKKSGRSIWDDEARSGVTEMARRNEELRRRMTGQDGREGSSAESGSASEVEDSDVDEPTTQLRELHKNLKKLEASEFDDGKTSSLASMKFMKKAEAARQAQNEADIKQIRRELDGGSSSEEESEPEANNIGRMIFGPTSKKAANKPTSEERNEFEEAEYSELEEEQMPEQGLEIDPSVPMGSKAKAKAPIAAKRPQTKETTPSIMKSGLQTAAASKKSKKENGEVHSKPDQAGWVTVTYDKDSDSEGEDSSEEILRRAFAGEEDAEEVFEKEKAEIIADEDDKIVDQTIPGWGSWVGEGLSKREQKRNKGKVLVKKEGIKPEDRKDAKLKNVIINQKRVRKNVDYMASTLPFPFTNRAEYERSIRMPIGNEWNVKKTYVESTKPRVIVKPGRVILPIDKPLI